MCTAISICDFNIKKKSKKKTHRIGLMAYSGSLGIRNSLDDEMDQFYILLVAFQWFKSDVLKNLGKTQMII